MTLHHYLDDHKNFVEKSAGNLPESILAIAGQAIKALAETGLPHSKDDNFKKCPLVKRLERLYSWSQSDDTAFDRGQIDALRLKSWCNLVFINGNYSPELSDKTSGVSVSSLQEGLERANFQRSLVAKKHPLELLNSAYTEKGHTIVIEGSPQNLQFIHINTGLSQNNCGHNKSLIFVEKKGKATLFECHVGNLDVDTFHSGNQYIYLDSGAHLEHAIHIDYPSPWAYFHLVRTALREKSHYAQFCAQTGEASGRFETSVDFNCADASAQLNGAYTSLQTQAIEYITEVNHHHPHTHCHQLIKGLANHQGKANFRGKITVHPQAHDVESHQLNKNLNLSKKAQIHSSPMLFIDNDNVKCTHGATIGQLDESQIFYMQSRGFETSRCKQLLASGFLSDCLSGPYGEELKGHLFALLSKRAQSIIEG